MNNPKRKLFFLGETFRADAITWMNGLKEFGDFEIETWELKQSGKGFFGRLKRIFEYCFCIFEIKKIIKNHKPDLILAERATSYGFLAAISGVKPIVIAQQGISDLWPENSVLYTLKKILQDYAYKKADLIHAWGIVMIPAMLASKVTLDKILVLPKGIDLSKFENKNSSSEIKIQAIVTRSLYPEYCHDIILKAFAILNKKNIDFELTIVGDGNQIRKLKQLSNDLEIDSKVIFTGRILNTELPKLLQKSNLYISMPNTEGVSASLFEAMACNCYPIVSKIEGNKCWVSHQKNGQLVAVNDFEMLATEIIWAFENVDNRKKVILENRKFVEENANYAINMKIIAEKYHELINLKTDS
jgi:glycosyltransferase involved in cell wall biosynthesis